MNFFLLSFLVCLSNAQLITLSCIEKNLPTKEFILNSWLIQFPTWVSPPEGGSFKTVLSLSAAGTVYRSTDRGANWEEIHLPSASSIRWITTSPDNKDVILVGKDRLFVANHNEAKSFTEVQMPAYFVTSSFDYHPRHRNWILVLSSGNCNRPLSQRPTVCSNDLFLSQDGGITWKLIRKYVWTAAWHGLEDRDNMIVIWERREKSGNMYSSPSVADITISDNFWGDSNVLAADVTAFLVLDGHIFFAQHEGLNRKMVLKVSRDMGDSVYSIDFPGDLAESKYRILDTSEGSTKIAVIHSSASNWAHVYGSVAADREFVLELQHVSCPQTCDYGKLDGLEGVYLANQFQVINGDFGSSVKTVITYDKGGEWKALTHPANTKGTAPLQLQGKSDAHVSYYSVPEAVGIIFANGNVGASVSKDVSEIGVYFSRDAGWTWQFVEPKPHIYEYGNRGALVIMVQNEETTDLIQYSINEGISWEQCRFGAAFEVGNIISDPDFGTRHFLMYGHRENKAVFVSLDFSQMHERECKGWQTPNTPTSDYEYWTPKDREDNDCLLGRTMQFTRRKQDAACFNPLDFTSTSAINTKNCTCTYENYECGYCFVRSEKDETCVKDTEDSACESYDPTQQPADCRSVWYESKGYEHVPGDTCEGGLSLGPIERPCAEVKKGSSNSGLIVFLVILLILLVLVGGTWFLSGRNATVREWVLRVVPERIEHFLPELQATESGYAPVSLGEVFDSEETDAPEVQISDENPSSSSS